MPKIFISRPLSPNSPFIKEFKEPAWTIISQSLIQYTPIAFKAIPKTDWIFFYSKNGVKYFFESAVTNRFLAEIKTKKQQIRWAAMGEGTAKVLANNNITPDFIGNGEPESTASAFLTEAYQQKVLFIRAKQSKNSIQNILDEQIAALDLIVYENHSLTSFDIPFCHFLVFTSPLNALTYFKKYAWQKGQKVIAIGSTTATKLTNLAIRVDQIAEKPNESAMVAAILQLVGATEKYAVIDLGTNTFHLLIAEKHKDDSILALHRQRFFVKLAEEGIEKIGLSPFNRGLNALQIFRKIVDTLNVSKIKAIGTAALRRASNGSEFIKTVKEKYNIDIELITGQEEASLIYKGVVLAVPFQEKNYLIMDIGGGSVEFIIANKHEVLWTQSFPIGVAVLYKKFHHSEPISKNEIAELCLFIDIKIQPLYKALRLFPTNTLVGASGTFDVLEYVLAKEQPKANHAFVAVKDFIPLYNLLLNSTKEERFAMKDVPDTRADMIVVAVVLIDFIIKKASIEEIIISNYALKEGVLSELMS